MQNLYREYRDRASFLTVYVKEAHPLDEWQMDSNEEQGVCYAQPVTFDDRVRIARDFVERCEYDIPLAIDRIDNSANEIYAGWPERLYVIDADGRIAYKGETGPFGYHPEEVAAWLMMRFPPRARAPIAVSAERIEVDPIAVTALEYQGSREPWRLAIDRSARVTLGRGKDERAFTLSPERVRAVRVALRELDFFGWDEACGEPRVGGRTRSVFVSLGDAEKIVHVYDAEDSGGRDRSRTMEAFDRLWTVLRAIDGG